jgi:putative ABC transport system permease protein
MIVAAGATSARRAKGMPDAFRISTYSIACGAGSVIALMTWLGVIDTPITTMVPVGSMLIANAMHTNNLVMVAARRRGIHLQKELIIAMVRGLVP